jgi:Na+-driven multidrug efflux pump
MPGVSVTREALHLTSYEPLGRGYLALWFWFLFGLVGLFFPHVLAGQFLDDPQVVRWIAVPMLIVCGALLADYHFQFSKGWI